MFTASHKVRFALGAATIGVAVALSGCATADPLATTSSENDANSETIVVASQAYYSNEIIAEIYAQALENAGFEVERKFQIGQRDAYLTSLENGEVDIMPEYTGNLLQFYSPDTMATESDEVYAELFDALPEGLKVLDQASATDQDSYNVTAEFAAANSLTSLEDLAKVSDLQLGGSAELEERPYGPSGLKEIYGATVGFTATGNTSVDALLAGTVNIANVYSADPRIQTENLVTLSDPQGLFLASHVVPLVNADIADSVADTINAVSEKLTSEGLIALNVQSTVDEMSSDDIATAWLSENGLK